MKAVYLLLFVFCYAECRKTYAPYNKHANIDFINMEAGGGVRPGSPQGQPASPPAKIPAPAVNKPATPTVKPAQPQVPAPTTAKPVSVVKPVLPVPVKPAPAKPTPAPHQIKPVPVNPPPVANKITTPGPGTVKQLVNFYDSQGKASPIRPYSYSQAVKQG